MRAMSEKMCIFVLGKCGLKKACFAVSDICKKL